MPWIIHGFNKSLQTALSLTSSGFYISFGESIFKDKIRTKKILDAVSYTHLRAHETVLDLVCRLLLEKKKKTLTQDLS